MTQVTRPTAVEADHLYVIAPGQDLAMKGTTIRVVERGGGPLHAPVDLFFRTPASASLPSTRRGSSTGSGGRTAPRPTAGGMGIGLAAAREFSRLLGGEVEVESEPGRGSTFRVWLPRTGGGGPRS